MRALLTIGFAWCVVTVAVPAVAEDTMIATQHTIDANGVRLSVWEKSAGSTEGRPVVVLAHGSATAGRESFDLQVAGLPDTSLMDALARDGFDVFAPDMRGFGRSTRPEQGVTTEEARDDLLAVIDHVRKLRGADKVDLVAWSWGTQYAGLAAAAHPEKIARYVSYAQMHAASPDVVKRRERLEDFRKSPYLEIPEAGWKKRFTSMTPEAVNDPAIVDQFAKSASAIETKTPTGPQIDMTTRLLPFFAALPSPVKSYVIIPGAGHMAHLQKGRTALQRAIAAFLKPD